MTSPIDYEATPPHTPYPESTEDTRRLRILNISHSILGWLIFAVFGIVFFPTLCLLPMNGLADEPGTSGLMLMFGALSATGPGVAAGFLLTISGRRIGDRNSRPLSLFSGGILLLFGVLGTAFGVIRITRGRNEIVFAIIIAISLIFITFGLMTWRWLTRPTIMTIYDNR